MSRMAIVFRHGDQVFLSQDNGKAVLTLSPRNSDLICRFGRMEGLREMCMFSRRQLIDMRAHRYEQNILEPLFWGTEIIFS